MLAPNELERESALLPVVPVVAAVMGVVEHPESEYRRSPPVWVTSVKLTVTTGSWLLDGDRGEMDTKVNPGTPLS